MLRTKLIILIRSQKAIIQTSEIGDFRSLAVGISPKTCLNETLSDCVYTFISDDKRLNRISADRLEFKSLSVTNEQKFTS